MRSQPLASEGQEGDQAVSWRPRNRFQVSLISKNNHFSAPGRTSPAGECCIVESSDGTYVLSYILVFLFCIHRKPETKWLVSLRADGTKGQEGWQWYLSVTWCLLCFPLQAWTTAACLKSTRKVNSTIFQPSHFPPTRTCWGSVLGPPTVLWEMVKRDQMGTLPPCACNLGREMGQKYTAQLQNLTECNKSAKLCGTDN